MQATVRSEETATEPGARARRTGRIGALALVLVVLGAMAACGGGGSDDDKKAGAEATSSTTAAIPDKAEFCKVWARFQSGTSYHPDMNAYRTFWTSNDTVAKELVAVAPDAVHDDAVALAKGVAAIKDAVGRATSSTKWSPEETKLYLKHVRLPEISVSTYADQSCAGSG